MADLKQLEFYMLRYVPHMLRPDCVSIGVLLLEPRPDGFGFADMRMTSDWRRVHCFDPQVDIEVLQSIEADIRMQLQHPQDVGSLLHKLEDSFANLLQITARQVCLAADPALEFETLCSIYLEQPQLEALPATARPKSENTMILAGIKDALTRAGIWALRMEKIKAVEYTKKKNDPLVFDFGYLVGTEVRFFQAVPLKTNTNQAVILAHRFPKVADRIYAENRRRALLTAVVSDNLDRTSPNIEFALDAFKENNVDVATVVDMPLIADRLRQDLNALGQQK
ncbi:MAG: DUF3037 domain-containing protein [Terriglobales bacterium]